MKDSEEQLSCLSATMRLYADMRFKQLTLLLAWLALTSAAIAHFSDQAFIDSLSLRVVLAVASMVATAVLWVMEVRSTLFWVAIRDKFPELWPRPQNVFLPFLNATNMVFFLYCFSYTFWWWCSLKWDANILLLVGFGVIGCLILVFTVINYWRLLWFHKD